LNEKSRFFFLFLLWRKTRWCWSGRKLGGPLSTSAPFRLPHTCLPICHMPPYHQSTPNHVSLGLLRRRPRGAACQHFLAQNQISRRKSGQPETSKPGMRPQTQKCTSLFYSYVMNLAVSPKRRTAAAITGIDMKLWVCRGRVTDIPLDHDRERILLC